MVSTSESAVLVTNLNIAPVFLSDYDGKTITNVPQVPSQDADSTKKAIDSTILPKTPQCKPRDDGGIGISSDLSILSIESIVQRNPSLVSRHI